MNWEATILSSYSVTKITLQTNLKFVCCVQIFSEFKILKINFCETFSGLKTWTMQYLEKPESDEPLMQRNVEEEWNPHYKEKLKTHPNQEIGNVRDLMI